MDQKESKIALISGGSRGLGLAIAENLAKESYNLVLVAQDLIRLETARDLLTSKYGVEVMIYSCDLSDRVHVEKFMGEIDKTLDKLDLLVNNAGRFVPGTVLHGDDTLDYQIKTNLYSAYYLTRGLISLLRKSADALIINICSVAGLQAYDNGGSYSISKFAMRGFSLNLRQELRETNIRVSTIYPGAFYSDSWKDSGIPPERMMSVEDVATTVSNLTKISSYSDIEEIILRPKKGDI